MARTITFNELRRIKNRLPEGSIHTIMTSGSIIVLVLAILGSSVSSRMISEVSITLSIGALIAILLILFVLPGLVACCDKLISRPRK